MKSIIESTLLTLAAVLSFAPLLATSTGQAQNLSGAFTLPFEAHWGAALLAPGAEGAIKSFIDDGLFIGQSQLKEFTRLLLDLAENPDEECQEV